LDIQRIIRYALSLTLSLLFLLHVGEVINIPILTSLENQAYDARLKLTLPKNVDKKVVIVDIDEKSLQAIFDLEPEVILIGTGDKQVFLPPATQVHFFRRNFGFEVMTTDAACRTFNVLAAEGRHVVAALLPLTR
jgi:hypothetical protein